MNELTISLMQDGSLFDIEAFGESLFELLPTIYKVDIGNKTYELGEDSNEFINNYSNATDVTIHVLMYQNQVNVEKVDW